MRKIKRPNPVDQESIFHIDELFFSKTDLIGNIISGNDVFVRVSHYSKEELMGQPHNVIRHPDMPRFIFKVLWDYIKADKIIAAYVKNLTKDGHFYWVLAVVFPVQEGYLSIRIKPSSLYFDLIPDMYKALLESEGEDGDMNASEKLLIKTLNEEGFRDYHSFMTKVLVEELNSRQKLIDARQKSSVTESDKLLNEVTISKGSFQEQLVDVLGVVQVECSKISGKFGSLFENFKCLLNVECLLKENTKVVLEFSESMAMLSLNAGIECHRVGEDGQTLSVVAKVVKKKSEKIENLVNSIVDSSDTIAERAEEIGLNISITRLQSAMIDFFAKELWEKSKKEEIKYQEFKEARESVLLLGSQFLEAFDHLRKILNPLKTRVCDTLGLIVIIINEIKEIEKSLPAGNIEAARIGKLGEKFILTFNSIHESAQTITKDLIEFEKELVMIVDAITLISESSLAFVECIDGINNSINNLNEDNGEKMTLKSVAV